MEWSMMEIVGTTIGSILTNMVSSDLWQRGLQLVDRHQVNDFLDETAEWSIDYINSHDGTILTTNRFATFLECEHPIENMLNFLIGSTNTQSKKAFINSQIDLFNNSGKDNAPLNADDTRLLFEFFDQLYLRMDSFYSRRLAENERYSLQKLMRQLAENSETDRREHSEQQQTLSEIKAMISRNQYSFNKDSTRKIYQILSDQIWQGKITEVWTLAELLKGKNTDLEFAIEYLLSIVSTLNVFSGIEKIQEKIIDEYIYTDLIRKTICIALFDKNIEILQQISDRNKTLYVIVQQIINGNFSSFFDMNVRKNKRIKYYDFSLKNLYPGEKWLVSMIVRLKILELPMINAADIISSIGNASNGFIDRLVAFERSVAELVSLRPLNPEKADNLIKSFAVNSLDIANFKQEYQKKYYLNRLRIEVLYSQEKAWQTISEMPKSIIQDDEIQAVCLQLKIDEGTAAIEELLSICLKSGQYWLVNNYLVKIVETSPEAVIPIIDNHKFLLSKDIGIFLIYVQVVFRLVSKDSAEQLLSQYSTQYDSFLDYWSVYDIVVGTSDEELQSLVEGWFNDSIQYINRQAEDDFIAILMNRERYHDVISILDNESEIRELDYQNKRAKAFALINIGRELDALDYVETFFDPQKKDIQLIDVIIVLSIKNLRVISDDVFCAAKQSNSSRLLMLASVCAEKKGNYAEAVFLEEKALLGNKDDRIEVYAHYLGLHMKEDHSKEENYDLFVEDTVATLFSEETGQEKAFCIHKNNVLPEVPYDWHGVTHIYKEGAIKLNLYRKKVKDKIEIDGVTYSIEQISSVDTFYFKVCIDKQVEHGNVKMFTFPVDRDGNTDMNSFMNDLKQVMGDEEKQNIWLTQYEDLNSLPAPLIQSVKHVNATYSQLVSAMILEPSILFRECIVQNTNSTEVFVFSFSSIVALFCIGFPIEGLDSGAFITDSLHQIVKSDKLEIISNNSRDVVASLRIIENQPIVIESSEEQKQTQMQFAVKFDEYVNCINRINNSLDLQCNNPLDFDIKELLGVPDYDALCIAQAKRYTLVSAEVPLTLIASLPEISVPTIGIADFIAMKSKSVYELLVYTRKLFENRFSIPITLRTIQKLVENHPKCTPDEQEALLIEWSEILEIPMRDEKYKNYMADYIKQLIVDLGGPEKLLHPIGEWLLLYTMKYFNLRLTFTVNANGMIEPEVENL